MKRVSTFIYFLLLSSGIAFLICLFTKASSFSILEHKFRPSFLFMISTVGIILLLLLLLWHLAAKAESRIFQAEYKSLLREDLLIFLPFSIFLISPLLLNFYLTSTDFRHRLTLVLIFALIAFVYLKLAQINRHMQLRSRVEKTISRFKSLSSRKRLAILFIIAFVIYNICTFVLVSSRFAYTGDEPYYLLTTHSLYQDQDINVADEYKDSSYFNFYPKEIYPNLRLRAYARFGRKGTDYAYPISQPGISVLMLPYYWLSQFFKGKTLIFILKGSLAIWSVLLGLQLYLFAREHWKRENSALILWFIYSFSAPVLFYSIHLYPEIPIALFSFFIFRKIRSAAPISTLQYFFLGFMLSLFFWFGLKYNMIFWPLLIVSLYFLLKEHKAGWKIICFLFFPFLSLGLNYLYIYELYGTYNPIAIYEGVVSSNTLKNFKDVIINTPVMLRIDSFLDYFLDQRDGLLLYSPLYFFVFLGIIEAFRKSKKDLFALLFISAPFILNYAFFAHRQGSCPQGRVLSPLSWVGIILVGYFLIHNRKKIYTALFKAACLLSLVIPVLILRHPSFLYQPTTHEYTFRGSELFISLSNLYFYLPGLLPSFLKHNNLGYIPNYIWMSLILFFVLGYLVKKDIKRSPQFFSKVLIVYLILLMLFTWFSLFPRTALILPLKAKYSPGKTIGFYVAREYLRMINPGEFHLTKNHHDYNFIFASRREIEELKIKFGTAEGNFRVELKLFDKILFKGETTQGIHTISSPSPPAYRFKNSHLYQMKIKFEQISGEPVTKNPFFFSIYPKN